MSNTPPRAMSAHNNLHALLFQATSAEYVALCLQAYQLARHALLQRLESGTFRNPAIVFDLDETVIDNSAYAAWQIANGTNYDPASWNRWCEAKEAEAVPGALDFIRFAEEAGATPIFITSRDNVTRKATLKNLAALGVISEADLEAELKLLKEKDPVALARATRLFMAGLEPVQTPCPSGAKTWPMKNKFDQRAWVEGARGYEVILSVGDNLGDYAEYYGQVYDKNLHVFYVKDDSVCGDKVKVPESETEVCDHKPKLNGMHPSVAERRNSVLQDAGLFGRDFILIPNPSYGGWLRAFEANQIGASDELAKTSEIVREPLAEPQLPFTYTNPKDGKSTDAKPRGPKFGEKSEIRIWKEE